MKQRNKYSLKQRNKYSLRWGAFLLVLVFANGAANSALVPQTTIGTWTRLNATIGAAAGKKVIITLSTPFVMGDFKRGSCINIEADNTGISIVGSGAVFDAGKTDRFFYVARARSTGPNCQRATTDHRPQASRGAPASQGASPNRAARARL